MHPGNFLLELAHMKRAFAIAIVVVLALGMVGMFFPLLLAGGR